MLASQVTDARATMALYRLHKTEWENTMWKETQAFLSRGKKNDKSSGASGSKLEPKTNQTSPSVHAEGKKRKAAEGVEGTGAATKKAKKASGAGSSKKPTSGGVEDAGDWWLA